MNELKYKENGDKDTHRDIKDKSSELKFLKGENPSIFTHAHAQVGRSEEPKMPYSSEKLIINNFISMEDKKPNLRNRIILNL